MGLDKHLSLYGHDARLIKQACDVDALIVCVGQMLTKARAGDRHALAALFFRVSNPFGAEDDEADMMGAMGEGGGQENCVVM